ncbi:MAG TPA: hypothetical protein VFM72_01445 [Aequorivita sp.]|nr:hypothetical protein [Aequorivita sp.]
MGYSLAYILLLMSFVCSAQDYYRLEKNGHKYQRPIYYLNGDDFEHITKISDDKIIFLSEKSKFIHIYKKHASYKISKEKIKNINFVKPESLYRIEEKKFEEKTDKIKQEKGFRPVPPLKHIILKVIILMKEKDSYCLYEVDWLI